MSMSFSVAVEDSLWGCSYQEVLCALGNPNIKVCFAKVTSLHNFATRITDEVLDSSWMTQLDAGTRRAYETTVDETAEVLVKIFRETTALGSIGAEFGEVMVSMGSARALERIFNHKKIPIAELWKPQLKQNEGFDFHTVCTGELINFGEAKYSGSASPHGLAINQAAKFVEAKKHLRDRVHLINLVDPSSIKYLDGDSFGIVAAFSLNAKNPLIVLKNAFDAALEIIKSKRVTNFYLVGVGDEC